MDLTDIVFLVQETKISLSGPDQAGSNRSVSKPTNNRISSNMEQIKLFVDLNYLILERIRSIQLEMKLLFSCRSMTELTMVTNGFTPYGYGFWTGSKRFTACPVNRLWTFVGSLAR